MRKFILIIFVCAFSLSFSQDVKLIPNIGATSRISFSDDNEHIVSIGASLGGNTITIWDIKSGRVLENLNLPIKSESGGLMNKGAGSLKCASCNFSKNRIITSDESSVTFWDIKKRRPIKSFRGKTALSFIESFDNKNLITCHLDRLIHVINRKTGKLIAKFQKENPNFDYRIASLFDYSSKYTVMLENNNQIELWNILNKKLVAKLSYLNHNIITASLSRDGNTVSILTLSKDSKMTLIKYNVVSKQQDVVFERNLKGLSNDDAKSLIRNTSSSISFDGKFVVLTFHKTSDTEIWDTQKKKSFSIKFGGVDICFDGKSHQIAYSENDTIKLIDLKSQQRIRTFISKANITRDVNFNSDGSQIVFKNSSGAINMFDLTNCTLTNLVNNSQRGSGTSIAPKDNYLLYMSGNNPTIYNLKRKTKNKTISPFYNYYPNDLSYSHSGKFAVGYVSNFTSFFTMFIVWDIRSWEIIKVLYYEEKVNTARIKSGKDFIISPDDKRIAFIDGSGSCLVLWDIAEKTYSSCKFDNSMIFSVAFHPNNKQLMVSTAESVYLMSLDNFCKDYKVLLKCDYDKVFNLVGFSNSGEEFFTCERNSGRITIHDVNTLKIKKVLKGHSDYVHSVRFSPDDKTIVTSSQDATIKIWDKIAGKEIASLLTMGKSDYALICPDRYYTCSKNATELISYVKGNKVWKFDQFDLQYNRPDIVLSRMPKPDKAFIKMYRKAYEKRLKKVGFNEKMFSPKWHTPNVKILNYDEHELVSNENQIKLKLQAYDTKYSIYRINIWINNVPIKFDNLECKKDGKKNIERTVTLKLSNGNNKVQVSTLNSEGVESSKKTINIVYKDNKKKANLFISTIGISKYQQSEANLNYAAKDAKNLSDLLSMQTDEYNIHKIQLLDEQATKANILKIKQELKHSDVNDMVILFFAGHGLLDEDLDYYLATHDIDFRNPSKNGLKYEDLENLLSGIPARKKILLLDACHSGEVDKEDVLISDDNSDDDLVFFRDFASLGESNKSVESYKSIFEFMKILFVDLRRGTGTNVISAARGGEFAYELDNYKNGVFTYSVMKGLKSGKADLNGNGEVSISELRDYVFGEVSKITKGRQNPTSRRDNYEFDYKVWQINNRK